MAASSASLMWLEKTKLQIQNLQEWKEFSSKLYDAVQQQMTENNINFFNDLSETEKIFVLEKAAKALKSGAIYNELSARISSSLEENILSYVAQEQQDANIPRRQSEVVSSHIQDGVVSILESRPCMKGKLHVLLNQPLPVTLRTLIWKLQLSNAKARMDLTHVSMNKARSVLDLQIALHCEELLSKEQTFNYLKDNKGIVKCMRNVVSYFHKQGKINLLEEEYLLLVPLAQTVFATSKPTTSLDSLSMLLAEEYITFMDSRPSIMLRNEHPEESETFKNMSLLLQTQDQSLAQTIQNICASEATNSEDAMTLGLQRMLQPVFQVFFVGYLNMNTLLYVWDQYILGLDEPEFNCLPAYGLAFLILLQRHLNGSTASDIQAALKTEGTSLSVQEFQTIINRHFYQDLFISLHKGGSDQFPVHDPTQATPHWSYVTKVTTYPRTRPQDRREAREEREMLKRQMAENQQREEQNRIQQEEEQKRQHEERLNQILAETRRKYKEDKAALEDQLKQEQQRSYEVEKRATQQINELQGQIRRLLKQRKASLGGNSVESLMAPPPSINSPTPTQISTTDSSSSTAERQSDNFVKEVNGKTTNVVILDLLQKMMKSADTLINGQTLAERDILNSITRIHLKHYSEDVRNAEIEIFGRELELNELNNIKEPKKTSISKRLSEATKSRSEARYMATRETSAQNTPHNVT
ncbi:uncharacterized protein [Phyllobates terribilis]|uniref:uncharacterized protein isoform X2 n=1 Tax=Phyllobates terribilis TaxID=111132 RepID=UPI003CCB2FB8